MHMQYLKIIQLTCFRMFCEARGRGVTLFKGSKRGDVPRVGGGDHVFLRDPKGGGVKKNSVNRNENLDPPSS